MGIGRLTNGTYTNGSSTTTYGPNDALFYGLVTNRPSSVPTTGTATFGLLAFTPPAYSDGSVVTDATLYGGITLQFGSSPLFGIEGSLLLKDDGVDRRYDFTSTGGLAAPSTAVSNRNGVLALDANATVVTTDSRCSSGTCRFTTGLALGGTNANLLAGVYGLVTNSGNRLLAGAAIYQTGSPVTTAPALGGVSGYTLLGYSDVAAGVQEGVTILPATGGGIDGYRSSTSNTLRGTATNTDTGTIGDLIGWTRWVSGTTESTASQNVRTLTANNGGIIWGQPATNLPTSGTATYTLSGGTAPSFGDRLGTLDGARMAVAFDTLRVGLEATLLDGSTTYQISSAGGVAAPSMVLSTTTMQFSARGTAAIASGGVCSTSTCSVRINGLLVGSGASNAAVAYTFGQGTATGLSANGVIAFTKGP